MLIRRLMACPLALLALVVGLAACAGSEAPTALTPDAEVRMAPTVDAAPTVTQPQPAPEIAPPPPLPPPGSAVAAPPPAAEVPAPQPTLPRKVLLLGDSVMAVAEPYLEDGFRAAGIDFVSHAFPGTSLLGGTDVTHQFAGQVAAERPDVVIVGYSGVYLPPVPTAADGAPVGLATPAFWELWRAKAEAATRDLAAHGARVYWVLHPHDRTTWSNGDTRMTDLYLGLRESVPGTRFVDWRWVVAGIYGMPLDTIPIGPGGAPAPVRGPDGGHFSYEATAVLAREAVSQVIDDHRTAG